VRVRIGVSIFVDMKAPGSAGTIRATCDYSVLLFSVVRLTLNGI
jgi:hypothetical protein